MLNFIEDGNTFVFYNGMIGTVTKSGRISLVSPAGYALAPHRHPNAIDYINANEVKYIDRSYPDPDPMAKKDDVLYKRLWTNSKELVKPYIGAGFKLAA